MFATCGVNCFHYTTLKKTAEMNETIFNKVSFGSKTRELDSWSKRSIWVYVYHCSQEATQVGRSKQYHCGWPI